MLTMPALRPFAQQMLQDEKVAQHAEKMRDDLLVAQIDPRFRRAEAYLRSTWDKTLIGAGCQDEATRDSMIDARWTKLVAEAASKNRDMPSHVIAVAEEMGLDQRKQFLLKGLNQAYEAFCQKFGAHMGKCAAIGVIALLGAI